MDQFSLVSFAFTSAPSQHCLPFQVFIWLKRKPKKVETLSPFDSVEIQSCLTGFFQAISSGHII